MAYHTVTGRTLGAGAITNVQAGEHPVIVRHRVRCSVTGYNEATEKCVGPVSVLFGTLLSSSFLCCRLMHR